MDDKEVEYTSQVGGRNGRQGSWVHWHTYNHKGVVVKDPDLWLYTVDPELSNSRHGQKSRTRDISLIPVYVNNKEVLAFIFLSPLL